MIAFSEFDESDLCQRFEALAAMQPDESMADRAVDRVRRTLCCQSNPLSADSRIYERKHVMLGKCSKYAAAVAVVIIVIGLWQYFDGKNSGGVAWADVAQKMDQIKTFTYREQMVDPDKQASSDLTGGKYTKVYWSADNGWRSDLYLNEELFYSVFTPYSAGEYTVILWALKKYDHKPITPDKMTNFYDAFKRFMSIVQAGDYTALGRDEIDGHVVEGVEFAVKRFDSNAPEDFLARLWVDVQAEMPVRMEVECKKPGSDTTMTMVHDQFEWNPQLDADLFQPVIPPDYTVME
jgi:outer membrane lipoprotein-sorting protein